MTLLALREAVESRIPAYWLFVPVIGLIIFAAWEYSHAE